MNRPLERLTEWDGETLPFIPRAPICIFTLIDTYDGGSAPLLPPSQASRLQQLEQQQQHRKKMARAKVAERILQIRRGMIDDIVQYGAVLEQDDDENGDADDDILLHQHRRTAGSGMDNNLSSDRQQPRNDLLSPSIRPSKAAGIRQRPREDELDNDRCADSDRSSVSSASAFSGADSTSRRKRRHHRLGGSNSGSRQASPSDRATSHDDDQASTGAANNDDDDLEQNSNYSKITAASRSGTTGPLMHVITPDHNGWYFHLDRREQYYVWRPDVAVLRSVAPQLEFVGGQKNSAAQANTWFLGSDAHTDAIKLQPLVESAERRERAQVQLRRLRKHAKRLELVKLQRRQKDAMKKSESSSGPTTTTTTARGAAENVAADLSSFTPRDLQFMASDATHQVSETDRRGRPAPILFPGKRHESERQAALAAEQQKRGGGGRKNRQQQQALEHDVEDTRFMTMLRAKLATQPTTQQRDKTLTEFIVDGLRFVPRGTLEGQQFVDDLADLHPMLAEAIAAAAQKPDPSLSLNDDGDDGHDHR